MKKTYDKKNSDNFRLTYVNPDGSIFRKIHPHILSNSEVSVHKKMFVYKNQIIIFFQTS